MFYLVKTPWWMKQWIFPDYTWSMQEGKKKIYLTFDDGPHPEVTIFVLNELRKYNAKATFFCIGKNVQAFPGVYYRILSEGHSVGNHTNHHLNGWKTDDEVYLTDIIESAKYIDSGIFRPPYGRITRFQAKQVQQKLGLKIIMWSVLSGDFDVGLEAEKCWKNVRNAAKDGSIIVFHDSEKAVERMVYTLPKVLNYFVEKGFVFERINS